MIKNAAFSSLYAAIAVGILYTATPFVPTTLLINPVSLEIEDDHLEFVRTVRIPILAKHQTEVTQGREIFPQCNASGSTLFERRPGFIPVEWHFPCVLEDGEYDVAVCVTATWFGLDMRPACLEAVWYVGEPVDLKLKVENLQRAVDSLSKEIIRQRLNRQQ